MRKNNNLIKLGDAIDKLFKQEKLDVKMSRFAVKNAWNEIAGDMVAKHTTQLYFDDKKNIFVQLDSSVLKNEISYQRQVLIEKINKFCGYELVNNLIVK